MDSIIEKLLLAVLKQALTPEVVKQAEHYAKEYAVKMLEELAKSTENKVDDYVVSVVKEAFAVSVPV